VQAEFDRRANVALIKLVDDPTEAGRGGTTYTVGHQHARGIINLEFDRKGRLIEIEVMGATRALPAEFLAEARRV
jgi:hypothetical protein